MVDFRRPGHILLVDVVLALMYIVQPNQIRINYYCTSRYFYFNSHLKQLYINSTLVLKMDVVGVGVNVY